jgi:hypothetical protein
MALARERTIPIERPPPVSEVRNNSNNNNNNTGKAQNEETTENSHVGHCTHTSESANIKAEKDST